MSNPQVQPNPVVYPDRYFLGVALQARPDWPNYFLEPHATRSTKPDSVKKEVEEKREKQAVLAATSPVSATVTSVTLLDQNGHVAFATTQPADDHPGMASLALLTFLGTVLTDCLTVSAPRLYDTQVRLFGFYIRDRLKTIALDALHYCRLKNIAPSVPIGLWYHRNFDPPHYIDPYEVFVPSEMRHDVDFAGICDFLRISRPSDAELILPQTQAELARQVAIVGQMFVTTSG